MIDTYQGDEQVHAAAVDEPVRPGVRRGRQAGVGPGALGLYLLFGRRAPVMAGRGPRQPAAVRRRVKPLGLLQHDGTAERRRHAVRSIGR